MGGYAQNNGLYTQMFWLSWGGILVLKKLFFDCLFV